MEKLIIFNRLVLLLNEFISTVVLNIFNKKIKYNYFEKLINSIFI